MVLTLTSDPPPRPDSAVRLALASNLESGAVAHARGRWCLGSVVLTLKGQVVIDEPLNLPEGSEVDLIVVDPGDDLGDGERERLHATLVVAREEIERGEGVAAEDLIEALRRQHR